MQIEHLIKDKYRILNDQGRPPDLIVYPGWRQSLRGKVANTIRLECYTMSDIKEITLKNQINHWCLEWEDSKSKNCSLYHKTLIQANCGLWEKLKGLRKSNAREIIEVCTGHGNLRYIMNLKGQSDDTQCRLCGIW